VSRLSLASHRHDPYWDLDGSGARRSRTHRRFVRWGVALVVILVIGLLVTRLPAIDASVLTGAAGKPILAGAILSVLAACVLVGLARLRSVNRG
jgi:hypothetical protein